MRNITISPALNGYVCQVSCTTVVFESRESLVAALTRYLLSPLETEKEFLSKAINPMPETRHENAVQQPRDCGIRGEEQALDQLGSRVHA
jgi:hypothetical protein